MKFDSTVLENGLTIATEYSQDYQTWTMDWVLRYGSRHEAVPGVAHFFEHMLANNPVAKDGAETTQFFRKLSRRQGTNMETSVDKVSGYVQSIPEFAESIIPVFGRLLLEDSWRGPVFGREKGRIFDEVSLRTRGAPARATQAHHTTAYNDHPASRPIGGTLESVTNMTEQHILDFKQTYLQGQKMLVVFTGPFEHEKMVDLVGGFLSEIPRGTPVPAQDAPVLSTSRRFVADDPSGDSDERKKKQILQFIWNGGDISDPIRNARHRMIELFSETLGEEMRRTGTMYDTPGAAAFSGTDYGMITMTLPSRPAYAERHIDMAFALAADPDRFLKQELIDELDLRSRINRAYSSPAGRGDSIADYFRWTGDVVPYGEIGKNWDRNTSLPELRAAYDLWKRDEFNVVAWGDDIETVPAPAQIIARRGLRPA